MENNIYKSPESDLNHLKPKEGSLMKGIIWGITIDIGGTFLFSIVFGIIYATILSNQGYDNAQITKSLTQVDFYSPISLFSIAIGLMISFFAGYYCAKRAGIKAQRAVEILSIVSGLFCIIMGYSVYSSD